MKLKQTALSKYEEAMVVSKNETSPDIQNNLINEYKCVGRHVKQLYFDYDKSRNKMEKHFLRNRT